MEKQVYKAIGEDRDREKIEKDLTALFESKGIKEFEIQYTYVFDSPGYDVDCVSVAWIDEDGLNLVVEKLESC